MLHCVMVCHGVCGGVVCRILVLNFNGLTDIEGFGHLSCLERLEVSRVGVRVCACVCLFVCVCVCLYANVCESAC